MEPQDGLDNDCDGLVDEEAHNNRSDDFDDLVDEDLGVVDGQWSPWSVGLVCSVQCAGTGELVYLRSCTNPEKSRDGRDCQGPATRSGDGVDGVCYSRHIKCPSACENGTWGYDCVYPCPPGCQDVCDKVTGRCRTCKHGYDLSPDRMCGQGQDADMNLQPLGDNQNSKEESLISDSESPGWMIYTTVVIIAILIFVGIAYEIYKRLRNSLQGRSVGSMFNKKGDDDDDSDDEDASVAPSRSTSKQKT
ncbi:thrombospondin-1-like [Physella acuta]|uniref:thrombospondin-1-like n=1 Tax=Physella acuta TaxID=109671 RepID=UPI0027DC6183|nr:thrombospondin-1-like [Physella acuta]